MTFYFALFFCFGQEYSPLNLNTTLNNTSNLHSSVIFIIEMKTILLLQTQVETQQTTKYSCKESEKNNTHPLLWTHNCQIYLISIAVCISKYTTYQLPTRRRIFTCNITNCPNSNIYYALLLNKFTWILSTGLTKLIV